jgi:hypothetical protein
VVIRGYLDKVSRTEISGWAVRDCAAAAVTVKINGAEVGVVQGGTFRPDLAAHGLPCDAGFTFKMPISIQGSDVVEAILPDGTHLVNSPWTLRDITVAFILSAKQSGSTWFNLVLGSNSWSYSLGEYYRPFTMPGHRYCRLCEADGLPECMVLHGLEHVPDYKAFHFASERVDRRVIVDCSKQIDWCRKFIDIPGIDVISLSI